MECVNPGCDCHEKSSGCHWSPTCTDTLTHRYGYTVNVSTEWFYCAKHAEQVGESFMKGGWEGVVMFPLNDEAEEEWA